MSSDVAVHHARIVQLLGIAHRLQELVTCVGLEARYDEHLEVILKLQDDVNSNLRRLLAFRETWSAYDLMIDKLEYWMDGAEKDLDIISTRSVSPGGNTRQFWVSIYLEISFALLYFVMYVFSCNCTVFINDDGSDDDYYIIVYILSILLPNVLGSCVFRS